MKKRLSLLMAALMIITLLPISAFAAANAVYTTLDVEANETTQVPVNINFKFPDGSTVKPGKFRIEIDNGAKFKAANAAQLGGTEVKLVNFQASTLTLANTDATQPVDNIIFVELKGSADTNTTNASIALNIPVIFPNTGDVMLKVIDESNVGIGTLTPAKIAVVRDQVSGLSVTAKDAEKTISFDGGELSQFEIKNFAAIMNQEPTATHDRILEITLDDDAFKFDTAATKTLVDGSTAGTVAAQKITFTKAELTAGKSILVIPALGRMGRSASEGSVKVNIRIFDKLKAAPNTETTVTTANAIVGKVVDYSVTMTIVEKGKKEMPSVWGGEKVMVTVTLKGPKGSIADRPIDFKANDMDVTYSTASTIKPGANVKLDGKDKSGVFKDGEFSLVPTNTGDLLDKEEVKFEIELQTDGSHDGVATLTAAQRGWEVKADAVKVTPKFKTTAELNPVKKGEARDVSEVKITEAKAGLLEKGERLVLTFNTRRDYTQFTSKSLKVEATNGMKLDTDAADIKWIDGVDGRDKVGLAIPVLKSSSGEPAVITISGLKVSVDGSATDDVIKLTTGLVKRGDDVKRANLIVVSTAEYIKVVKEYDLESILTVFTIGQTQYTVNGEAKTAASAPYIKNGKTMLPIRALSESLGLAVQWNGATKTATFTDSSKVAAVTIGAEKMFVNGTPIPLAAKAELVNGTTFVELRSLATAFGVQIDWDAAAKTATVSK